MAAPLYLGIDLGTTNSSATIFDGERLDTVRGPSGEVLTPSVVRIDARGLVSVGTRAHRLLQRDPENIRGEFKRLMGSRHQYHFAAANVDKSPEELAACVLGSLRKDVESMCGVQPERAVIAVPALFELQQIAATSEAARLAGFARVETIQEPVASALASGWTAEQNSGAWLVYDLGGGTFDASLLETQDGLLRVVGHDGNNFLGGRDFDFAIVDWLIERIAHTDGLRIERSNPEHLSAIAQLKVAAEEAKIELSRGATETTICVEDLRAGTTRIALIEEVLSQDVLTSLTIPLIDRSAKICHRLLRTHGIRTLERIVLVGGPTMMPWLRARLAESLQAPFSTGLDPMLLVAQGAALFAASAGLDARPENTPEQKAGPRLWLQFPAMTPDLSPYLVGRIVEQQAGIKAVRFARSDAAWESGWLPVESDGTFCGMLHLKRRASSRFSVEVQLDGERIVAACPAEISLIHGTSVGDPPLARTIGVAKADNSVAVYAERGSPLPLRKTFTHRTVETVSKDAADYAMRIPIVQGDFPFAHLCRLVGVIQVPASELRTELPARSVIDVTLEIDRGGALTARAAIPSQDLMFDHVEQLVAPATPPEQMERLLPQLQSRAASLRTQGFRDGQRNLLTSLTEFESSIEQIRKSLNAARGGDQDAAEKARREIIDCDGLLGDLESAAAWPELTNQAYEEQSLAAYWLDLHGTEVEKRTLVQCGEFIERAMRGRNSREVERQLRTLRRIRTAAYLRDPNAYRWELDHAAERVDQCSNPAQAHTLVQRGRAADAAGNRKELERAVRALWELLPLDEQERRLGFNSGVT